MDDNQSDVSEDLLGDDDFNMDENDQQGDGDAINSPTKINESDDEVLEGTFLCPYLTKAR